MRLQIKKPAYAAAACLGLFAGAAGIASAATGSPSSDTSTTAADTQKAGADTDTDNDGGGGSGGHDSDGDDASEAAITGSVDAPAEQAGTEEDHAAEQAVLTKLAKISEADAKAKALAAVPGTANDVRLEHEDGFVVYSVEVTTTSGDVEVIVDAGNGAVLAQEADGVHERHGGGGRGHSNTDADHEANESPERAAQEAKDDAAATGN